jgi:C-terminal processing protease CtpA/Prc
MSFHPLRPLLYTQAVVTPGLSLHATKDNIRSVEKFLETTELSSELEEVVEGMLSKMHEHRGAFVPGQDDVFKLDGALPRPERVAVLADRGCVSSCESLVWAALQSDKTTVFGENTGGFTDYGDVVPVETPCPAIRLNNPISRSNRIDEGMALDNIGIDPDVRVPPDVLYWIEWVRERL